MGIGAERSPLSDAEKSITVRIKAFPPVNHQERLRESWRAFGYCDYNTTGCLAKDVAGRSVTSNR